MGVALSTTTILLPAILLDKVKPGGVGGARIGNVIIGETDTFLFSRIDVYQTTISQGPFPFLLGRPSMCCPPVQVTRLPSDKMIRRFKQYDIPEEIQCWRASWYGMPFRTASVATGIGRGCSLNVIDGYKLNLSSTKQFIIPRQVSLAPFIANTIFWGCIFALFIFLYHAILHYRRRNRCPSCGYSLLGLLSTTCPECGQLFAKPRV